MNGKDSARSEIYRASLSLEQINDPRIIAFHMITPNTTVLDVGCACGDFGAFLKRHKNCTVHGVEYDALSLKIAETSGAYASLTQHDLESVSHFGADFADQFDFVVILDVLEHLTQPLKVLNNLKRLLKPRGVFIISLPNVAFGEVKLQLLRNDFTYTDTGILDKTHLRFFTYKSIAELITDSGLLISEVVPKLEDFTGKAVESSMLLKSLIARDAHSFVFQYVLSAQIPNGCSDLLAVNLDHMKASARKGAVQVAKRLRWIALKNTLFPFGSIRHNLFKRLLRGVRSLVG